MSDTNDDYLLALSLQNELNSETTERTEKQAQSPVRRRRDIRLDEANNLDLNSTSNIVHPEWEVVDPTPDVHAMFTAFNYKFFQGRLECVLLEWSKRMYSCAGICYSRRNRFGMQCTIRLSEPLLKLRSRKNLVETLLHEMIHAYLFIKNIREENGGHGPNFKKIMQGINQAAGTNITVYHTFHDEVEAYRTHWWRCNGICQHRAPFFGYVKRTSNRAPGTNDRWWMSHHNSCGGTFEKIKEPEKPAKKIAVKKPKLSNSNLGDIRKFTQPSSGIGNVKGFGSFVPGGKMNSGSNTVVVRKPPSTTTNTDMVKRPSSTVTKPNSGNLTNVIGFKDLNSEGAGNGSQKNSSSIPLFSGEGNSLTRSTSVSVDLTHSTSDNVTANVRNIWAKRFHSGEIDLTGDISTKKPKIEKIDKPGSSRSETKIDDDVFVVETKQTVIDLIDSDNDDDDKGTVGRKYKSNDDVQIQELPRKSTQEIHSMVLKEIQESDDDDDCRADDDDDEIIRGDVILIDDEYDDQFVSESTTTIADTSVVDDLFGEDTLLKNYMNDKKDSDLVCTASDIDDISCPLCQEKMLRNELCLHLDWCQGIRRDIKPKSYKHLVAGSVEVSKPKILNFRPPQRRKNNAKSPRNSNPSSGIGQYFSSSNNPTTSSTTTSATTVNCPVCNQPQTGDLNLHLDRCLIID